MDRDIAAEARSWRETTVRSERSLELSSALKDLGDEDRLVEAYQAWWVEYTAKIRSSPTVNSWEGISQRDARAAGASADSLVVELLSNL